MEADRRLVALVTGDSCGVGAATTLATPPAYTMCYTVYDQGERQYERG